MSVEDHHPFAENILNYALYFILIYWVLSILGLPVSSLLAGAGIAGVAIGLGAQGFLSDLVNGFFILIEHQFDVGDVVRPNGPITIEGNHCQRRYSDHTSTGCGWDLAFHRPQHPSRQ